MAKNSITLPEGFVLEDSLNLPEGFVLEQAPPALPKFPWLDLPGVLEPDWKTQPKEQGVSVIQATPVEEEEAPLPEKPGLTGTLFQRQYGLPEPFERYMKEQPETIREQKALEQYYETHPEMKPRKYKNFIDELLRNTGGGALNVASGAVGTLASVSEGAIWDKDQIEGLAQKLYRIGKRPAFTPTKGGGWEGFVAASVGQAAPYMGAAVGATLLTGTPLGAFGVGYAVEGDNAYRDAIEAGASEEEAQMNRFIVGVINASIETLQVSQVMKFAKAGRGSIQAIKKAAQQRAWKKVLAKGSKIGYEAATHATREAIEEILQETTQIVAISKHDPKVWDTATERILMSGLGGGVVGLFLGGGGRVITTFLQAKAEGGKLTPQQSRQFKELALTPQGAELVAAMSPEVAAEIAAKETPSRSDLKKLGVTGWNAEERKQLSSLFTDALADQERMTANQRLIEQAQESMAWQQREAEQAAEGEVEGVTVPEEEIAAQAEPEALREPSGEEAELAAEEKAKPAEVTPEKREQAVDYVKGILADEKYAALPEQERVKIGQKMLAEFGVEAEAGELLGVPAEAKPKKKGLKEKPAEVAPERPPTVAEPSFMEKLKKDLAEIKELGAIKSEIDWKASKPGDYLGTGENRVLVIARKVRPKYEAQSIADKQNAQVMIDTPDSWAVVKPAPPTPAEPVVEKEIEYEKEEAITEPAEAKPKSKGLKAATDIFDSPEAETMRQKAQKKADKTDKRIGMYYGKDKKFHLFITLNPPKGITHYESITPEIPAEPKLSKSFENWLSGQSTRNRAAITEYLKSGDMDKAVNTYRDAGEGLYGGDKRSRTITGTVIQFAKDRADWPGKPVKSVKAKPEGKVEKPKKKGLKEKPKAEEPEAEKPKKKGLKEKPAKSEEEPKRIISKEAYEKARKRLIDPTKLRAGLSPQDFADLVTVGAYHFESGVRKFADWSKKMIEEFGDRIKPHLQAVYDQITTERRSEKIEEPPKAPPPIDITAEPPGEPTAEFGESFLKRVTRRAEEGLRSGKVYDTPKSLVPLENEVVSKLKSALQLSEKEQAVIAKEKKQYQKRRVAQAHKFLETEKEKGQLTPEQRLAATVKFFKGEQYSKQRWKPIEISEADRNLMHAYVEEHQGLGLHTKRETSAALNKLFDGFYLANHEIAYIAEVFPELGKIAVNRRAAGSKGFDIFMSIIGFPKTVRAAFDVSLLGRQMYPLLLSKPSMIPQGTWQALKMFWRIKSAEYAKVLTAEMRTDPAWKRAKDRGVAVIEPHELSEEFPTKIAGKIPGIARSERAFVPVGNLLRVAAHDMIENIYIQKGKPLSDKDSRAMAQAINDLSGRSDMPKNLKNLSLLSSAVFWSPRLVLARFKAPFRIFSRSPAARNLAIRSFTTMASLVTLLCLLAKYGHEENEDIDGELNPLSTDFGKIRYKNSHIDLTAGYGPLIRTVARVATGMTKGASGEIYPKKRLETIKQWGRAKTSPVVGFARKVITQKDWLGRPAFRPPEGSIGEWMTELGIPDAAQITAKEFYDELVPLPMADVADAAYIDGWASGLLAAPLAFGGIGILTYEPWASTELRILQNKLATKAHGRKWDKLAPSQQADLRKKPAFIEQQLKSDVEELYQQQEYEIDKVRYKMYRNMSLSIRNHLDSIGIAISAPSRRSGDWIMNDKRYDYYVDKSTKLMQQKFAIEFRKEVWKTSPTKSLAYKQKRVEDIMTLAKKKARAEVKRLAEKRVL